MKRIFVLAMLFAARAAYCELTLDCSQREICNSYLDMARQMIYKAQHNIPTCNNCANNNMKKAVDCADILLLGHNKSGVYEVWPMNRLTEEKSLYVYCDMDTNGGGWTVIQRRGDFQTPKDYFYQGWESYKDGFGDLEQDFWLGNDKIFALTNQKLYSARFDLRDVEKNKRYAVYDKFWVDDENHKYTLHISVYTGDAGDSMGFHNNFTFTTFDKDNDGKCAETHKGGWWYGLPPFHCHEANLNGLYYTEKIKNPNWDGISWNQFKNGGESLEGTEIKIRPKHFRAIFG